MNVFLYNQIKKTDGMTSLRNRAESDEFGLGKETFNGKKVLPEASAKKSPPI